MKVTITLFTEYYTIMGRNSGATDWMFVEAGKYCSAIDTMSRTRFDYYKIIKYDLETYDDEPLYKQYYRRKIIKGIIDEKK